MTTPTIPDWLLGLTTAVNVVTSQTAKLDTWGIAYQGKLDGALGKLSSIALPSIPDPKGLEPPNVGNAGGGSGDAPTWNPQNTPDSPDVPDTPTYGTTSGVNLGAPPLPPDLSIAINVPPAPTFTAPPKPNRPNINTDITLPNAPTINFGSAPSLRDIDLPDFKPPAMPVFSAIAPTFEVADPTMVLNWAEPVYQSEVLADLTAWVREHMQGGLGIPAAVEDALFARARERESAEAHRAVQEAVDTWAARGFTMPHGMLVKQTNAAHEQSRLKAAELNRDIWAEATKMQIESIRFAVQQGVALEQLIQNAHQNMCNRLFESAKFLAQGMLEVYRAKVSAFEARCKAFDALVAQYKAHVDGVMAYYEGFKAQIQGAIAQGQLNEQLVEVYKAGIMAEQAKVEVFASQMKAAAVEAEVIKAQFDGYRADVQAFAELVGAEKAKFDVYTAQVNGETAKAQVVEARVRGYAAQMQGYAAGAEVVLKQEQIVIENNRNKVQEFLAGIERFKAEAQKEMAFGQYEIEAFKGQVAAYEAGARMDAAHAELQVRVAESQQRTNIAFSEMAQKHYEAKINEAVQRANIALESAKAQGQFSAQMAAGAMSALNVGASVTGNGSQSVASDYRQSFDENHNYNYSS